MIRARQAHVFVGRQEQLQLFEDNLSLPIEDPRRRFLFNVFGNAGIGKTFLVRQLDRVARERGWLTGYVDHAAVDVPEAMSALIGALANGGARCKKFMSRFDAYQQRRRELDADPSAPEGMSALLTRSAVRVGLRAAGDVPFLGALASTVDEDAAADRADRLRRFVAGKFRNDDDIRLVLSPVEELTPVFVADLTAAATTAPVAVFLDTYERTGTVLDPWLLDLLGGRYGELPVELMVTVAGQHPLDANRWADFLGFRADMPLRIFTEDEARQLLTARGVTDPRVVEVMLTLSGRLPVLLAMLAQARPDNPGAVGDPSGSAVERFLRWEHDDTRRQAALLGALPRTINADILAAAVGRDDDGAFAWLRTLPFVAAHASGYQYHDVVRTPMLRHVRRESPNGWRTAHSRLANLFRNLRDATGLAEREGWQNAGCAGYAREAAYHQLCASHPDALVQALHGAIDTYTWSTSTDNGLAFLTVLADETTLDSEHRARAFAHRGRNAPVGRSVWGCPRRLKPCGQAGPIVRLSACKPG